MENKDLTPIEGWEQVAELLSKKKVDDWINALGKAEQIFRREIMTLTNAESLREAIKEMYRQGEFTDPERFLEARNVYRDLSEGRNEEVLDHDTAKELADTYRQAIIDINRPETGSGASVNWVWLVTGTLFLIGIPLLLFTSIGQNLLQMLEPIFRIITLAVLGVVGLGIVVLAIFLYLDYRNKSSRQHHSEE